jgi:hypothetical protein
MRKKSPFAVLSRLPINLLGSRERLGDWKRRVVKLSEDEGDSDLSIETIRVVKL